jgi:hypothetical protein
MATTWIVTTDRNGVRCYVLPTGQVVAKDGIGTMPVSVYYAGFIGWGDYASQSLHGMTDTVREGKAWALQDATPTR